MSFNPSLKEQLDIMDRLILLVKTGKIDLPACERRALFAARGTVFTAEHFARVAMLNAAAAAAQQDITQEELNQFKRSFLGLPQ